MSQSEIDHIDSQIATLKNSIMKTTQEIRALTRLRDKLRTEAGAMEDDEELYAEYIRTKERFMELSRDPSKTNQFRMLALSQKLERIQEQLRSLGREVLDG